jgi:hypothetical protein
VSGALVEKNVIHVGEAMDVQMVVATQWDGWARDVRFRDNVFKVAGIARYGSETGRRGPDYLIKAGFDPAASFRFKGNSYFGSHIDAPDDGSARIEANYEEMPSDWQVPVFDPSSAHGFPEFIADHRNWMLAMLHRELGTFVKLKQPRPLQLSEARR